MKVVSIISAFPPSFEGNPWTYGFALFSLSLLSMYSLAQLWNSWCEVRKYRMIQNRSIGYQPPNPPVQFWSALTLYRIKIASLYLTIFIGAFPDVLILLLWGEASPSTMLDLFLLDRVGDALTLIPFSIAAVLGAILSQVIPQKLITTVRSDLNREISSIKLVSLMPTIRIGIAVLFIALGVTLGKAGLG